MGYSTSYPPTAIEFLHVETPVENFFVNHQPHEIHYRTKTNIGEVFFLFPFLSSKINKIEKPLEMTLTSIKDTQLPILQLWHVKSLAWGTGLLEVYLESVLRNLFFFFPFFPYLGVSMPRPLWALMLEYKVRVSNPHNTRTHFGKVAPRRLFYK